MGGNGRGAHRGDGVEGNRFGVSEGEVLVHNRLGLGEAKSCLSHFGSEVEVLVHNGLSLLSGESVLRGLLSSEVEVLIDSLLSILESESILRDLLGSEGEVLADLFFHLGKGQGGLGLLVSEDIVDLLSGISKIHILLGSTESEVLANGSSHFSPVVVSHLLSRYRDHRDSLSGEDSGSA